MVKGGNAKNAYSFMRPKGCSYIFEKEKYYESES